MRPTHGAAPTTEQRSDERGNGRNGYRHRGFDTVDVAILKLRSGSYFPEHLVAAAPQERRKAQATVIVTCYLLGVSTRRTERLVYPLGISSLSKSQVSVMAEDLDAQVEAFRSQPLDAGPYTFVAADALVLKVRENGRVVNVQALVVDGTWSEDGAGGWNFSGPWSPAACLGVRLVTSDAHAVPVVAIGDTLPSAL